MPTVRDGRVDKPDLFSDAGRGRKTHERELRNQVLTEKKRN